jgi:hypothetical protein
MRRPPHCRDELVADGLAVEDMRVDALGAQLRRLFRVAHRAADGGVVALDP